MRLWYTNVFVSDYERALRFYRDTLGFRVRHADPDDGYAGFDAGSASLAIVREDDASRIGRHTGVGFGVVNLDAEHARLSRAGVRFTMSPSMQPWGGYMAMFEDPDGNVFYLDQLLEA